MALAAGILGALFGLLHLAVTIGTLGAEPAARGSGEIGAVPIAVRWLGAVVAAIALVGGLAFAAIGSAAAMVALALGVAGVCAIAVANGTFMHGRPTVRHHLVRGSVGALIIALAVVAL